MSFSASISGTSPSFSQLKTANSPDRLNGAEDYMKAVQEFAEEYERQRQAQSPTEPPEFGGWVCWAPFYADDDAWSSRLMKLMDPFAGVQHIFMITLRCIMRLSTVRSHNFQHGLDFIINGEDVNFNEEFFKEVEFAYHPETPYSFQLHAVLPNGHFTVATVWIENRHVEVFSPFGDAEDWARRVVMTLLERGWIKEGDLDGDISSYQLPEFFQNNYWNIYFVYQRSLMPAQQVQDLFLSSDRREEVESHCFKLLHACGSIIAKSMVAANEEYKQYFDQNSAPFNLDSEKIVTMENILFRCPMNGRYYKQMLEWIKTIEVPAVMVEKRRKKESPVAQPSAAESASPEAKTGEEANAGWPAESLQQWKNFIPVPGAVPMKFNK